MGKNYGGRKDRASWAVAVAYRWVLENPKITAVAVGGSIAAAAIGGLGAYWYRSKNPPKANGQNMTQQDVQSEESFIDKIVDGLSKKPVPSDETLEITPEHEVLLAAQAFILLAGGPRKSEPCKIERVAP